MPLWLLCIDGAQAVSSLAILLSRSMGHACVLAFIEPPLSSICVASGGLGTGGSKSDDEQARDRVSRECKWV
eukprot:1157995-Pelagomonas_calceolata.AAC.1